MFAILGIAPPKGVLLYGPPGTGKTLLARACAAQTKATFLKLAGPQLVQMFIGDGAKLVRDAFALAKEKLPAIIFIDELDAIGTKRFDSEKAGDREVQRTMLELLNQLDGFSSTSQIKVSLQELNQKQPVEVFCIKNMFLKVSQISQEGPATLLKRDSNTGTFL